MLYAIINQSLPKLFSALSLSIIIFVYGLETLSSFYKAVSIYSLLMIISQAGIPAQYERMKLTSLDVKLYSRFCFEILFYSTLCLILISIFYNNLLNYLEYYLFLVAIYFMLLVSAFGSLLISYVSKRQRHKTLMYASLVSAIAGTATVFCIYFLNLIGFTLAPDYALVSYFMIPPIFRFLYLYIAIRPKILWPRNYFTRKKKIWEIRCVDVIKSFVGSSNSHLLLIFSSFYLGAADFALLGIIVTWGNRFILLFISSLKQITYPKLVNEKNNIQKNERRVLKNYFINFSFSLSVLIIITSVRWITEYELTTELILYCIAASFIYVSSPMQDFLKSRGFFKYILLVSILKTIMLCAFFYLTWKSSEGIIELNKYLNYFICFGFACHIIDLLFYFWCSFILKPKLNYFVN